MNAITFIKEMSEALLKEAATLRPYKHRPFTGDEYETPLHDPSSIPPMVNKGYPDKPLVPKPMSKAPSQESSDSGVVAPYLGGQNAIPTSSITVSMWVEAFKFKFNKMIEEYTSNNEITPEQIKDQFRTFVKDEKENKLSPENKPLTKEQTQKKFEAISIFERAFETAFNKYYREGDIEEPGMKPEDVSIPRNLSKGEVKAIFDRSRYLQQGREKAEKTLEGLLKLPEFARNDSNRKLLEEVAAEQMGSAVASSISEEDRKSLSKLFLDSYLNNKQDPESLVRWSLLLGQPLSGKQKAMRDQKRQERGEKGPPPIIPKQIMESIDPFSFISNDLFFPDSNNKDIFLSFFLEPYARQDMFNAIGPDLDPIESELLVSAKEGTYRANAMDVLQRHADALVVEMKDSISNPGNSFHHKFFDWVLKEIVRGASSKIGKEIQFTPDAPKKGDKMVDPFESAPDRGFRSDFRIEMGKNVFETEGLRIEGPKAEKGDLVDVDKADSLRNNWNRLNQFMMALSGKLDALYAKSTSPDQKINAMRKKILWSRVRQSCELSVKQTLEAISRGVKSITDERMLNIINQDWSELFKLEHLSDKSFSPTEPDIAEAIQKLVADGVCKAKVDKNTGNVAMTAQQSAYDELVTLSAIDYPPNMKVNGKKDPNYMKVNNTRNIIQQKAYGTMENLKEVLLDPDLITQFGNDTLVSFIEVVGFFPETAAIGALLAKKNRGTFDDKINYLTQLVRRGVDLGKTEEEIEVMSPQEISAIFDNVRGMLETLYSTSEEIRTRLSDPNSFFKDEDVSRFAAAAGLGNVRSKTDFAKLNDESKDAIINELDKSEFKKYCVDQITAINAMKSFLEKYISYSTGDQAFLQRNGFKSKDDFYRHIGVKGGSVDEFLDKSPDRRIFQVAQRYYPKLFDAYNRGLLKKTEGDKAESSKIQKIVDDLLAGAENAPVDLKSSKRPYGPSRQKAKDALFFAQILDAESPQRFAVRMQSLKKIANQRKVAKAISVRQKFVKMNADITIVDALIQGLKNGGRQSMGLE